MTKRANYYQVHKNKKPKRKVLFGELHPNVKKAIRLASFVVSECVRVAEAKRKALIIPKYKKGGAGNSEFVGSENKGKEVVIDKFGMTISTPDLEKASKRLAQTLNLTALNFQKAADIIAKSAPKVNDFANSLKAYQNFKIQN